MSEEQFWDKDCSLVIAYREAEKLRQKRVNNEFYLQGLYFYEALCRVSPVMNAFAKKGTKPIEWLSEPIPITRADAEKRKEDKEKQIFEKGKNKFLAMLKAQENRASQEKGESNSE